MIRFSCDFPALTGIFLYWDDVFRIYLKRYLNLGKIEGSYGNVRWEYAAESLTFRRQKDIHFAILIKTGPNLL